MPPYWMFFSTTFQQIFYLEYFYPNFGCESLINSQRFWKTAQNMLIRR
jgi:hypothetical protein